MTTQTAISKLTGDLTVNDIAAICEKEGVTVSAVCKALADGLHSDIVKRDNNGEEIYRDSDMNTRHKYMASALEVLRMVKIKDTSTVNIVNNISITAEEFESIVKQYGTPKILRQSGEIIDVRAQ